MKRFASELITINQMLNIPQPSRSRVLLEISADMQDLYEYHVGQGLSEELAFRRTMEEFDLTAEAIAAIAEVHDSPIRRFLDRFSSQTRSILEGLALALTMIPVVLVGYGLAISGGMTKDSGIWIWPLLAGTIAALSLGISKWYKLFVVKEHHIRAVRKRIDTALYIALGQLAIGLVGMYYDLFQAWLMSSADKTRMVLFLAHWLQGSSALLSTAMIAALVSGLIWIVNSGKAASIEQCEAELITGSEGESI
jgi:hypothetical protein